MIIVLMIILFILGLVLLGVGGISWEHEDAFIGSGLVCIVIAFILLIFGFFHGFIDYKESNDKDLARITTVTQEQNLFHTYYKVEVEYLTNTPTQDGVLQKKEIEKDTFYCYYENKELVNKLKENLYKEIWIISGYKGGYETPKDFGTKLIKSVEIKEE